MPLVWAWTPEYMPHMPTRALLAHEGAEGSQT